MYTGIVCLCHTRAPSVYEAKDIICLLDAAPILRHPQLKFWEWIRDYYQAFIGDVYQAAVPAGLKLESETLVCINPCFEAEARLSPRETNVLDALSDGNPKLISELNKLLEIRDVTSVIKSLLEKGAIEIEEQMIEKFRPKTETFVRLSEDAKQEGRLQGIFDELNRAQKQLALLMEFLDLSKYLNPTCRRELSRKELLDRSATSPAVLNALVEKGVLETYAKETGRLNLSEIKTAAVFPLNDFQQKARDEILRHFIDKQVVLLHGVTSSGKTELYIHLAQKTLSEGKQALYLVPEIALTTQLTARLQRVFGNRLGVYHSRFSDAERVEIWNNMLNDKTYDIIIGVRSSVFLPFRKLGLVIVDEEHETSYKQFDPAPRYHARNAAIVLASMHGAKTLLGTATPAVETYHNAMEGKYGLVELTQRHEEMALPSIEVLDTKEAYRKKEMTGHFSDVLLEKIAKAMQNREQIILFQNRRGYAPYLECKACNYVPRCEHCDVSLTVHKVFNTLVCHYCGYSKPIPEVCPVCQTPGTLSTRGFGTEKIEDEIKQLFPEARVARMDLDTTRSKKSYESIIGGFEQHKIDILIGTQMISKGLDFERVSLVGILNADNMLNFPDFRANERAFQMIAQVSGRAGRKNKRGTVVLQTSQPAHPIIQQVIANDYSAMFRRQCAERKEFNYPPYCRLIRITLRHRDAGTANKAAAYLAAMAKNVFGERVLGPNEPPVARIQNMYLRNILLKIETNAPQERAKELLHQLTVQLLSQPQFKAVKISLDVDPM
jgi:primosomal protein N' (replication factor Y)